MLECLRTSGVMFFHIHLKCTMQIDYNFWWWASYVIRLGLCDDVAIQQF